MLRPVAALRREHSIARKARAEDNVPKGERAIGDLFWSIREAAAKCKKLSVGLALNARFTTNGMCTNNTTDIYVARTSNIIE